MCWRCRLTVSEVATEKAAGPGLAQRSETTAQRGLWLIKLIIEGGWVRALTLS